MEIGSATEHRSGSRGAYVETVFIELFSGTEIGLVTKHHSGGTGWKLYFKNTFQEWKLGQRLNIILVAEGAVHMWKLFKKLFTGTEIGSLSATEHHSGGRGCVSRNCILKKAVSRNGNWASDWTSFWWLRVHWTMRGNPSLLKEWRMWVTAMCFGFLVNMSLILPVYDLSLNRTCFIKQHTLPLRAHLSLNSTTLTQQQAVH